MAPNRLSKEHAEAVTRRSLLADGSQCFRTSRFTQVISLLGPGSVLVTGIGYNSGECAPLVTVIAERVRGFRSLPGYLDLPPLLE